MDDVLEQDQHEERLKEVFDSFDASGCGSLCPEELADLCVSLHLEDAAPALLDVLLQGRDRLTDRIDFDQFKDALILALSSGFEASQAQQEVSSRPESPDIKPKFVKGSKRYGRRSKPELVNTIPEFIQGPHNQDEDITRSEDTQDNCDATIPRKRERWNADETSTEEYEAEGQLHLWNPDEPSTPQGCAAATLKEKLQQACDELAISWYGCAGHSQMLALCDYLGLEISADVLHGLNGDGWINVQEFVSMVLKYNKPATPSASTPYRQLKRQHSTQPFDEAGRRIAASSALMSSIGMRLFSTLDDGTGFTPVESIIDSWMEEGIENGSEILKALNFSLEGKLSLSDLSTALESELLATKNGIHRVALASFKAEIRHLLERIDGELREKEKIRSDLERVERLKSQLATEVDEHHSSIEKANHLNLRKLEEEHREKLAAVRLELMKEMDLIRQQAAQQREELEAEVDKIKEEESFLREHLSISIKENRRLEMDLMDCGERLMEAQNQVTKLRGSLDNVLKEKFGDLDPGSADFLMQEERIKQLRLGYEAQCRKLQDRVDELLSELQDFHSMDRPQQSCSQPLSEELEGKSPGVESDPGLGSEEVNPLSSMSLEAEMMLEQLKEQHLHQLDDLRKELECKTDEFNTVVEQKEDQKTALDRQHQQEVEAIREELASARSRETELQSQLERASQEQTRLEKETQDEVRTLRQQLLEEQSISAELGEQLRNLQEQKPDFLAVMEELQNQHASDIEILEKKNMQLLEVRLQEQKKKHLEEREDLEKRWLECFEKEKELMKQTHDEELLARLEKAMSCLKNEHDRTVKRLTAEWQEQRVLLEEQNNESLQAVLEDAMLRLGKEQERKESQLQEQHDGERRSLQEQHEHRETQLKQAWERERLQLEKDYKGMLQQRLHEEREKHQTVKEELQKRLNMQEDCHRKTLQEMTIKHAEERNTISGKLEKLQDNLVQEREQTEVCFFKKIKQVEDRFSADQELAAARFQTDILKLEHHYQRELEDLSKNHAEEKLCWELQLQKAMESVDVSQINGEVAAERHNQEWAKERIELEKIHGEVMQAVVKKNQELQHQVKTKEIELNRQFNDLHNRLQESLQANEDLLNQSEKKAKEAEHLLNQAVEDFQQEREEFQGNHLQLEAQYEEILSISQRQEAERIALLTERDDLKLRIDGMEKLLKQAVDDFELDRKELQGEVAILKEKLKESQNHDLFLAAFKNKETISKPIPDESYNGEGLDMQIDPMVRPEEVSQLKMDASEDQVNILSTFNTCLLGKGCSDQETSNFNEPDNNPKAFMCHGEDPLMPTDLEFTSTGGNVKDFLLSQSQDKEASGALEYNNEESQPQTTLTSTSECSSHKDELFKQMVVNSLDLVDPCELSLENPKDDPGPKSVWYDSNGEFTIDNGEPLDQDIDCELEDLPIFEQQSLYYQTREEIVLMREKIMLLQQKTDLLQSLLEHNCKKMQKGREYLEENYSLKVKMVLLIEHIKVLEIDAFRLKALQVRYEECECENATLKQKNAELKMRVFRLQSRIYLTDDISRIQQENCKLLDLFEAQGDILVPGFLRSQIAEVSCIQDCCGEFKADATGLSKAISELQNKNPTTQGNRQNLEQLNQEKIAAEHTAENLNKQVADLHSQCQQLQSEKGTLADKIVRSQTVVDELKQQLTELIKDNESREVLAEEKKKVDACMNALEAELTKALTETARLEDQNAHLAEKVSGLEEKLIEADSVENHLGHLTDERKDAAKENRGLRKQLAKSQETLKNMEGALQTASLQRACLRSDLRSMQQEKDSLQQQLATLHKQLLNASDRNRFLELALHNCAIQSPSKKLHRDTLQPKEQDDKASKLLLKQQHKNSQVTMLKTLEQENAILKEKLEEHKQLMKDVAAKDGHAQLDELQEENKLLKARVERLTKQLFESFHTYFMELLPASPCRLARGHCSDADSAQDKQGPRMEQMEARLIEIETSLRNVKLLLREKVAQLKEQVHKNSKADALIRDLYIDNGQLLKALEAVERQSRSAEKARQPVAARACGPSPPPAYNLKCA
ncbi:ninein isoform X2 [Corythoichthys intestinalis]|uniref:ninein isoform X2 n=1 Tax=Corythoichthys intestinalis TaxID=161448 RepID=UPI0025A67C87|nr:ninein isoform X2 [Corythoichthys intestinalis]